MEEETDEYELDDVFEEGESIARRKGEGKTTDFYIESPFVPCWDKTDHFNFVCRRCHHAATTKMVITGISAGIPVLTFVLRCDECGISGKRKIYLGQKQFIGMATVSDGGYMATDEIDNREFVIGGGNNIKIVAIKDWVC